MFLITALLAMAGFCNGQGPVACTCREGVQTPCPDGYSYFETTGFCYKVYENKKKISQEDARQFCINDGGDLASIHSTEENAFVNELANKTSGFQRYAYIGMMSAKNNLSDRHWTDGSPFDFTAWEKYKPQDVSYGVDGCGITYPMSESRPNTWDDWPCETNTSWTASAAVCKLPANTVLATNNVDPYFFMA